MKNSVCRRCKTAYIHGYFMDLALEEAAALLDIKQRAIPADIAYLPQ